MIQRLRRFRVAILFSLISWAIYGMATNTSDVNFYGLYQVGAESLVEFRTYTIGYSLVPGWKDAGDGDVFLYHEKRFPAKQPGAFFAAAAPYYFLHTLFGLDFVKNRELVSALNSWLSSGLIAAISVGVFYELLLLLGFTQGVTIAGTFSYAFCTNLFPYTGVPHHDVMATACLVFAFFFLTRFKQNKFREDLRSAGAWLGLTLFFSMLPALLVAILLAYSLSLSKKSKDWIHLGLGFLLGYLPLAMFNTYYFHNPFLQANVAGNYQDTFFQWSIVHMKEHFHDYFGFTSYLSATQTMPVFVLGIIGIFMLSKRLRKEAVLLFALLSVHCLYLLNIQTIGHCQFGPRYLIPLTPFMMLGFAGLMNVRKKWLTPGLRGIAAITLIYSFAINALGALGDTMYCGNLVDSPITIYWHDLKRLMNDTFLVRPYAIAVLILSVLFFFLTRKRNTLPVDGTLT